MMYFTEQGTRTMDTRTEWTGDDVHRWPESLARARGDWRRWNAAREASERGQAARDAFVGELEGLGYRRLTDAERERMVIKAETPWRLRAVGPNGAPEVPRFRDDEFMGDEQVRVHRIWSDLCEACARARLDPTDRVRIEATPAAALDLLRALVPLHADVFLAGGGDDAIER